MPDEDANRRFEEWKRLLDQAVEKHLKQFKKTVDDALKDRQQTPATALWLWKRRLLSLCVVQSKAPAFNLEDTRNPSFRTVPMTVARLPPVSRGMWQGVSPRLRHAANSAEPASKAFELPLHDDRFRHRSDKNGLHGPRLRRGAKKTQRLSG